MTADRSAADTGLATQREPLLVVEGLTKRFGGLTAVDDVGFQLPADELHCLIGPNGAGKSTFFKLVAGVLTPSAGSITYRDRDVTGLDPHERARRGISMKFQTPRVYPRLSVRDNLRIALQRSPDDASLEDQLADQLDVVDLQGKAATRAGELSHGEQQWLEIAMALAIDPTLLLLDEPTAGMTIEETVATGELIQSIVGGGVAAIVVEHDITFVRQIADRVTVMHRGRIFAQGSVEEIEADDNVREIYLGER